MVEDERRRRAPAMSQEERRKAIVHSTLPLLVEHGGAVTTSEIAAAAGIAEGTVFRAFKDKRDLLIACMRAGMNSDDEVGRIEGIDAGLPLPERLTEGLRTVGGYLDRVWTIGQALQAAGITREDIETHVHGREGHGKRAGFPPAFAQRPGAVRGHASPGEPGTVGGPGETDATDATGTTGTVDATDAAAGATGTAGTTGAAAGTTGTTGAAGARGMAGTTGATGATGMASTAGAAGAAGTAGTTGATGATGATGTVSAADTIGAAAGTTGAAGTAGTAGAVGAAGTVGVTDASGAAGGQTGTSGGQPDASGAQHAKASPGPPQELMRVTHAIAGLFAPAAGSLRLEPEHAARLLLGLVFTNRMQGHGLGQAMAPPHELVDLFLHGVVRTSEGNQP